MDELNNQNSNEPDNSQNQSNNLSQGVDPFANVNQDMYQNNDPYASLNPDSQINSPYGDMSSNPYGDPFSSMMPNIDNNVPQADNSDDIDSLMSNIPDNNGNFTNENSTYNTNINASDVSNQSPMVDSNINDFDNQGPINPILSQSLPNNMVNGTQNLNNNMQDLNYSYSDSNSMQNNSVDPNMNYQSATTYQENSYMDQNSDFQGNNFSDPNTNYAPVNNNSNQNMNNMNYQSGNYTTDFTKAWMGTLYDKAQNSKFNWPAALFGGAYFLFRKMYLTGVLFTLLTFLLNTIFMFLLTKIGLGALAIASVINIVFVFVYGFSFYPLYRKFVQNKLDKMKQTITDNSQLVNEAQKKGNTSVLALIIYFVVTPIIISIVSSILVTAGLISFSSNLFGESNKPVNEVPEVQEPTVDMQLYNFTDQYLVEYNSLTWFLDEENNSLTKGDYILQFAQALNNINESFNVDVTTPDGRSTLLSTLISSLEGQAAQLNLSVEAGNSNFIMGTNAFYGYVDVIDATTISRYYLILLPENNILFQFVLTVNDTVIDSETNLETINILTSVYEDQDYNDQVDEDNQDQDSSQNEVEDDISNETDEENNSTNINALNDISNNLSENDIVDDNTVTNISTPDNTASENVSLSDVLG